MFISDIYERVLDDQIRVNTETRYNVKVLFRLFTTISRRKNTDKVVIDHK